LQQGLETVAAIAGAAGLSIVISVFAVSVFDRWRTAD
jgi:hypothetical protein